MMRLLPILLLAMFFPKAQASGDETLVGLVARLADAKATVRMEAIEALVATGDERLGPFFEAYCLGGIYLLDGEPHVGGNPVTNDDLQRFLPLTHALTGEKVLGDDGAPRLVAVKDLVALEPNRRERQAGRAAITLLNLNSPNEAKRMLAARRSGISPLQVEALPFLERMAAGEKSATLRRTATESAWLIRYGLAEDEATRIAALHELGQMRSLRALPLVRDYLAGSPELSKEQAATADLAFRRMRKRQESVKLFDNVKFGLSTGSIYILMALGLSIIYGLMGVINMAHGEMMMVGAYTTFMVQKFFGHAPDNPQNHFFLFALPVSFLVAALVGGIIERLVVRKLYHRPFESLLATVGVSFILIQIIRLSFGDNQASNSPTWLVGGFDVATDMNLSYNRVFIFVLTVCSVLGVMALMRFTPFGLRVRATMQHRDMASCVGIHTRRIYSLTFMLGSGLAGLAGCALTTVSGITPDMGQNYIVDSFLIVVIGGVGELLGVVCSGLGMGVILQILENSFFSPVWAKIIILTMVVAFIQFRPAGLFPPKGRMADV